jgi:voltage-gated potassium channel
MDSLKESQRQIRIAIIVLAIIIPTGVIGFMFFEKLSFLNSIWLTVITLATVGYGDIYAHTEAGRVFTILLILFGLGAVAYGLQATATFILSPAVRDLRQRRRAQRTIDHLEHHYIICGQGELVDDTVKYLLEGAKRRQNLHSEQINQFVGRFLSPLSPTIDKPDNGLLYRVLTWLLSLPFRIFYRSSSLIDVVVVVTPNEAFASHLQEHGFLVMLGDPTNDNVLLHAGIKNASALMVLLDNDTEALLTVLTARNLNAQLDITAAALADQLAHKMVRVGANSVITHYDVAGRFLNNATLRPAVNDFFNSILFSQKSEFQTTQLFLWDDSPWINHSLGELDFKARHKTSVIGIRAYDLKADFTITCQVIITFSKKTRWLLPSLLRTRSVCCKPNATQIRFINHALQMPNDCLYV